MRVEVSEQVADFISSQAPDPRRRLRLAIRKLESGNGDIRALEPPLDGFCRLRVGGYRVIFAYSSRSASIQCLFVERRSVIYEVFESLLADKLLGRKDK